MKKLFLFLIPIIFSSFAKKAICVSIGGYLVLKTDTVCAQPFYSAGPANCSNSWDVFEFVSPTNVACNRWAPFSTSRSNTFMRTRNIYFDSLAQVSYTNFTGSMLWINGTHLEHTPKSLVTWSISNVDGLQSELDGKLTSYSPTLGVASNSIYAVGGNSVELPFPSFSDITSKPTTLSGYGITDAYPLTGNPSGFLTAEVDGSTSNEIQSISINSGSLELSLGGGTVALPSQTVYTAGSGLLQSGTSNVTFSVDPTQYMSMSSATPIIANMTGSIQTNETNINGKVPQTRTLAFVAGSGVSITPTGTQNLGSDRTWTISSTVASTSLIAGNSVSITTSGATSTVAVISPVTNTVSRSLNSNFKVSATNNARLYYTVRIAYNVTAILGSTGGATLQTSADGGSTWKSWPPASNNINLGVVLSGYNDYNLTGEALKGETVRIVSSSTNATVTIRSEQIEVQY